MAKQQIEKAIREIELEKEQAVRVAEQKITQEKLVPYNIEIDREKETAVQELSTKFNNDIKTLQEKYNADKNIIINACEEKKSNNAKIVLDTELQSIRTSYDVIINSLKNTANQILE